MYVIITPHLLFDALTGSVFHRQFENFIGCLWDGPEIKLPQALAAEWDMLREWKEAAQ
jgi:hypothetical protein